MLSYAIDQAVEVKVDLRQTISPHLHFQVGGEHLTSRFNVRQTRAYVVRNRAAGDRVVVIEHPIRAGWKLIEPTKAHEETRELYRFQLKVPAGQTASLEVAEEKPHVDNVALKSEAAAPYYPIISGVNAKVVTTMATDKLQSLRIVQGFVQPTLKSRKTTSYYVQNLSAIARTFSIDHVTPAEWTRVDKGKDIAGPATRRDKLEVEVGKVAQFDVVEERTHRENQVGLYNLPIEVVRRYQNDEATSTKVKDALERTLKMRERNAETKLSLAAVQRRLDLVMQDQARLRANLQIIPATSEPYKKFLEKFVSQETEIENLQQQIREATATVQTQDREMDAWLAAMNED